MAIEPKTKSSDLEVGQDNPEAQPGNGVSPGKEVPREAPKTSRNTEEEEEDIVADPEGARKHMDTPAA